MSHPGRKSPPITVKVAREPDPELLAEVLAAFMILTEKRDQQTLNAEKNPPKPVK